MARWELELHFTKILEYWMLIMLVISYERQARWLLRMYQQSCMKRQLYSYINNWNTVYLCIRHLYELIWFFYLSKITSRQTLDVNREINEAAQTCSNAEQAYTLYHNQIRSIINGFTQGKGILFDIHGQVYNNILKYF